MMALDSASTADLSPRIIEKLTRRQVQVIAQFIDPSITRIDAARNLNITAATLNNHLNTILSKFGVNSVGQAVIVFLCTYPLYREQLDSYSRNWILKN